MSTQKFAKLFESERYGQILVVLDQGDDGPQVAFSAQPTGFGVCTFAPGFEDTDDGWVRAEKLLKDCDQAMAEKMASQIFATVGDTGPVDGGNEA